MIRLSLSAEPGVFFNGIELRFNILSGKQRYTLCKHVHVEDLMSESLLDRIFAEFKTRVHDALDEHKRKCAGAEPVI